MVRKDDSIRMGSRRILTLEIFMQGSAFRAGWLLIECLLSLSRQPSDARNAFLDSDSSPVEFCK